MSTTKHTPDEGALSFAKYPDCKTWTVFDDERTLASKIPDEATAQRIVTACNSHEELLAALTELVDLCLCDSTFAKRGAVIKARAAIARAEGRAL